jgi:hypothetical protein
MSRTLLQQALATLKNCLPVNYCYNNFGDASPMYKKDGLSVEKINESIKALEAELAKPEPIYVMGNYAGEGKVVSASFGLPKGAFEFAPYKGAGEVSKIKHSIEPQPEQEPVAQIRVKKGHWIETPRSIKVKSLPDGLHDLYTAPPRKSWQGLTDAEIEEAWGNTPMMLSARDGGSRKMFARAIEAQLKELNT